MKSKSAHSLILSFHYSSSFLFIKNHAFRDHLRESICSCIVHMDAVISAFSWQLTANTMQYIYIIMYLYVLAMFTSVLFVFVYRRRGRHLVCCQRYDVSRLAGTHCLHGSYKSYLLHHSLLPHFLYHQTIPDVSIWLTSSTTCRLLVLSGTYL